MEQIHRGQPLEELEVGLLARVGVVGAPDPGQQLGQRVDRHRAPGLDRGLRDQHRQRRLAGADVAHQPQPPAFVEALVDRVDVLADGARRPARGPCRGPCPRPAGGRRRRPGSAAGIAEATPRGAPAAIRGARHSQGRATSSGPRIQPGAVADAERAAGSGSSRCSAASRHGARRRAVGTASSATSTSGGPSPGFCSTGRSAPPCALSTNRGYCSRKTTSTLPVGPLRCLAMISSASLGSSASSL